MYLYLHQGSILSICLYTNIHKSTFCVKSCFYYISNTFPRRKYCHAMVLGFRERHDYMQHHLIFVPMSCLYVQVMIDLAYGVWGNWAQNTQNWILLTWITYISTVKSYIHHVIPGYNSFQWIIPGTGLQKHRRSRSVWYKYIKGSFCMICKTIDSC